FRRGLSMKGLSDPARRADRAPGRGLPGGGNSPAAFVGHFRNQGPGAEVSNRTVCLLTVPLCSDQSPTTPRQLGRPGPGCGRASLAPAESGFLLAHAGVPALHRSVGTRADDALAVGAKSHAANEVRVPPEREGFVPRARLPALHRVVKTAADDAPAVGAHGHAVDQVRVAVEGQGFLAGGRVPDLYRIVHTAGDDAPAVGAKSHAADPLRWPPGGQGGPAAGRI